MNDIKYPASLHSPMPTGWILATAKLIENRANAELAERWPKHSHLTQHQLVEEVVERHLNAFWSYTTLETLGGPTQIRITRYNGKVDES